MACIYTGAWVHLTDYDSYVIADLFQCGNQILIQWEPGSISYDGTELPVTHTVSIGHGYHHERRGVTVVNDWNCEGERR